jgi:two-component system phosphate regulon sensor histidine kinase PhoR
LLQTMNAQQQLAALVKQESLDLLSSWRQQVRELSSARHLDNPTLNDHIPTVLDELATALESDTGQTIPESLQEDSALAHGVQRVEDGFDIEEVVAEYNILRGCIHDLGDRHGVSLQGRPFHIINRVFDHAIGLALQSYATQRAMEVQQRREEYLAFVVHDLRTPLSAISLAGRILELTIPEREIAPEAAKIFNALRRNVQQLEKLVDKVLEENTNLKTDAGLKLEKREFDLWPLVESLIRDLHPLAATSSTHLINQVPDDLTVFADASVLRRVFQNLIANAIKYTPEGNVIVGAIAQTAEEGVECWVTDNGKGIPKEYLNRIFDKGETDPNREGGLGLGLAIVKVFAEASGGKVTVESQEGSGSTFRFSLPFKKND